MDIELARTFLEIVSTGSFIKASERMHVTQTTVTARVRSLETMLDCTLFIRNRSGAKLTEEGRHFVEYASTLVETWIQAKSKIGLPAGTGKRIKLGAETSLWNPLILNWIIWIKEQMPDIAVESVINPPHELIMSLERNALDAIILHRPNYYAGFTVEQVLEEKLIHVCHPSKTQPDYFIDWGEDFKRQFESALPKYQQSPFTFNLGQHALHMMLKVGGNGWFRTRVVAPYLESGELIRVNDSPEFTYPVYLSYRTKNSPDCLKQIISGLRETLRGDELTII